MTRPSNPTPSQESDPPSATAAGVDVSEQDPVRTRRIWPWLIVLPLAGVTLALLTFNWRAAARLQAALDDLTARGEPITYAEAYALLAANPPADDDNLAGVPLLLAMHDSEPGRAMRRELELDQPELLEQWEQLLSYWGRNAETKASSIHRTSEDFDAWHPDRPNAYYGDPDEDWPWIEHDDGPAASIYLMSEFLHPLIHQLAADCRHRSRALWSQAEINEDKFGSDMLDKFSPQLNGLIPRVQTLRTIALAALECADPELAAASLELSLTLTRAPGEGMTVIGILVTSSMAEIADGPLYAGLSQQAWNDPQLARLQQAIEHTLAALDPEASLRMERVFGLAEIRLIKRQRTIDEPLYPLSRWESLLLGLLPGGTFDQLTVRLIEGFDGNWPHPGVLLPQNVHRPESNQPQWLSWFEKTAYPEFPGDLLSADLPHAVAVRARTAEIRLRLAHAAIALERFFLQHDRYPEDWQELIPAFLDQPPLDPFTWGVLVLLPPDPADGRERPVIYSLGPNCEDNGGTQGFDPRRTIRIANRRDKDGTKVIDSSRPAELGDRSDTGDVVWGYPGGRPITEPEAD